MMCPRPGPPDAAHHRLADHPFQTETIFLVEKIYGVELPRRKIIILRFSHKDSRMV
jgi:hypothetical protein